MLENRLSENNTLVGEIQEQVIDLRKEEQEKVVEPRKEDVVVLPDDAMKVISKVTVKGVTAEIDENIKAENIKLGVNILGIEGNVAPDKPDQEKTIYPSEEEQIVVADNGFELAKVIAKPVETESFEIEPSTSEQVVKASEGKFIKEVKVGAIEDIEPEIAEQEEKLEALMSKVEDLPVDKPSQDKVVVPSNEQQTIVADEGFKLGSVVVEAQESYVDDLSEQRTTIDELESQVNELSDKPQDMLQTYVDSRKSCRYLFYTYEGSSLAFLKNLDTSKVTTFENMFTNCVNLTELDLSNFNTSNVKKMSSMFNQCRKLTELDLSNFDTNNVTDMSEMFSGCESLKLVDLSSFDSVKSKGCYKMFYYCKSLETLNLPISTAKASQMQEMFRYCLALKNLNMPNFNTAYATRIDQMFRDCQAIETIPVLDMRNISTSSNAAGMFTNCYKLQNLTIKNLRVNLTIGSGTTYGHLLTIDSLLNTIKELWNLTESTTQTLTIGSANLEKLANVYVKLIDITDEMRVEDQYIDNKKPFVVCESTDEGAMTLIEYATTQKNWAIA